MIRYFWSDLVIWGQTFGYLRSEVSLWIKLGQMMRVKMCQIRVRLGQIQTTQQMGSDKVEKHEKSEDSWMIWSSWLFEVR